MNEKNNYFPIAILIIAFLAVGMCVMVLMFSTMIQARNLAASASIPEYNDGGAAGKFSSDIPIEDQIFRAEYDRQMSQ